VDIEGNFQFAALIPGPAKAVINPVVASQRVETLAHRPGFGKVSPRVIEDETLSAICYADILRYVTLSTGCYQPVHGFPH
jgi:hypothetical protein